MCVCVIRLTARFAVVHDFDAAPRGEPYLSLAFGDVMQLDEEHESGGAREGSLSLSLSLSPTHTHTQ